MKRSFIQCPGAILLCLATLLCLLFTGCSKPIPVPPFSQQPASLVDPALVRGVLPNGFQYVLLENHTPKDRVSMHLNVFAGSANETDQEQGIAHYLEHMVFNGSTHFKPGELIAFFQKIGMGFGPDANASTSYFTTIYDLNLPKGDAQYLQDALIVLQDYAKGALLLEEEVNRERGIILAEKRERDSVSYQMFKKELAFRMPGSLLTRRHPIGLQKIIEQADSKLLRQFYEKWYRPDNMMLVAVGDFDTKNLEALIQKTFSAFSSPRNGNGQPSVKELSPDIAWNPHQNAVKAFYLNDSEAQTTRIAIERIEYRPFVQQTLESMKQEIIQDMGNQILSQRLIRTIRHQKSEFSSGGAFAGQFLHNMFLASIAGEMTDADHWQTGMEELEHLLRQALTFGFTKEELARTKANLIAAIKADTKQSQTRKTPALARQILGAANKKRLFLSPAQSQELLVPFIENINLEQVHKAFKKTWANDHRLILVTGNVKIPENANKTALQSIVTAYNQAAAMPVNPLPTSQARVFPYLPVPDQKNGKHLARIVRKKTNIHHTGITTVDFENHTHLSVRSNASEKKQIAFSLVFGDGLQSQPSSMPGLGVLAAATVDESGFGKMDADQLEQALAGHNVSMHFSVDENFFSLNGTADSDELELVFQLIYTFLEDPGFSPQALALAKTRYEQNYNIQEHTTDGIYRIKGVRFLAGGDLRFGLAAPRLIQEYSLEDVKNWLAPHIKNAPVEFSVAGDVTTEKVIELAKIYLGGLNARNSLSMSSFSSAPIHFPQGKHLNLFLDTRIEKDMIRLCFPTDDYWNIRQTRRLSVLAQIFSERLRKTVREDLGAVYSPYAYNHPSRAYKDYGVFQAVATVAPGKTATIAKSFEELAKDLHENGVRQKELDLIIKPLLQQLKVVYKTNNYWLNAVMKNSFRFPQKLQWPVKMMEDYASISTSELTELAKQYLVPDHGAKITISRK